jgi:hypothetical protein
LDFFNPHKTHHSQRERRTRYLTHRPIIDLKANAESEALFRKILTTLQEKLPKLVWREEDEKEVDKWRYVLVMIKVKALHLSKSYFLPQYDAQMAGWRWRKFGNEIFALAISSPTMAKSTVLDNTTIDKKKIREAFIRFQDEITSALEQVRNEWFSKLQPSKSSTFMIFILDT